MSTQPPLAVCVSSWFVRNAVAALHRSWCSVFIPALQLNKWGPIRCFAPWMGCCYQHSICPTHSTTAASPRMYLWIFESDFTVIQMWKCFENENTYSKVFIEPPSHPQLSFLLNNIFLAFLLLLARSHIIRSECHCFSSFYRRFLMLRHLFVSWRGIRICQAYFWLCPLQQFKN